MQSIKYIETPASALKLLRPRHREIMRRLVCGQKQREIALDMGLNEGRLSIIVNSPLFQIELRKMERDIRERAVESIGDVSARIAKLQGPALDVLEEIVVNPDNKEIGLKIRKDAAMNLLELGGTKKHKNDEGMSDFAQFIADSYREAKQRAFERIDEVLERDVQETEHKVLSDGCIDVKASASASANADVDVCGDVLAVDEAEDAALVSFVPASDSETSNVPADLTSSPQSTETITSPDNNYNQHSSKDGNGNGNGSKKIQLNQLLLNTLKKNGISAEQLNKILDEDTVQVPAVPC